MINNQLILKESDRIRISFKGMENITSANIFIGSYRWHPDEYACDKLIFSSNINGAALISAYVASSCK